MKDRRLLLLIGVLLLLTLLTVIFLLQPRTRFDWRPTYKAQSKEPYGTHIIAGLLRDYFPGKGFNILKDSIVGVLPVDTLPEPAIYVFIGDGLYLDSAEVETLLTFISTGNVAFISSLIVPSKLMQRAYEGECEDYEWEDYAYLLDSTVRLGLRQLPPQKALACTYLYRGRPKAHSWSYIESIYFCDGNTYSFEALGDMNDSLVNFAAMAYGEGTLYLHTTPLAFSNIQLLQEPALQYANSVFSYLPPGKIYWDEYSKISEPEARLRNNRAANRSLSAQSPLSYIIQQPPLAWAWYLLLSIGLLFLLFRTKRRQRIIPVLEPNKNTSLEFVRTIGQLYFLQGSYKKLALQKMKLLLNFARARYHLRGQESDPDFVEKLARKSEVPRELIDRIVLMHRNIGNSNLVTENTLIDFHRLTDEFYRVCK